VAASDNGQQTSVGGSYSHPAVAASDPDSCGNILQAESLMHPEGVADLAHRVLIYVYGAPFCCVRLDQVPLEMSCIFADRAHLSWKGR
jgi:hypothetical protein